MHQQAYPARAGARLPSRQKATSPGLASCPKTFNSCPKSKEVFPNKRNIVARKTRIEKRGTPNSKVFAVALRLQRGECKGHCCKGHCISQHRPSASASWSTRLFLEKPAFFYSLQRVSVSAVRRCALLLRVCLVSVHPNYSTDGF